MLSIVLFVFCFLFFTGRRQNDATHKEFEVCSVTRSSAGTQAGRVVYTCAPVARAHIHGVHEPAPPDVMCVSVYVDRDQRWVLEHFRPPALHTATALTV